MYMISILHHIAYMINTCIHKYIYSKITGKHNAYLINVKCLLEFRLRLKKKKKFRDLLFTLEMYTISIKNHFSFEK